MPADLNLVTIEGAIVRNEVISFQSGSKMTVLTVAGERTVVGGDGKERAIPFYQRVEARFKEGEEAAKLAIGTPVFVEGNLHYRETGEGQDKKRATNVRGRTVRAMHGVDLGRISVDAQGNPRLKDGYCRFVGTVNVSRAPESFGTGTSVRFGAGSSDSWQVLEDGALQWKEHTNWFNLVAWDELGLDIMGVGVGKGTPLFVEADIENRSYDDKNGRKVYATDLNVRSFKPRGRMGEAAAELCPAKGAGVAYAGAGLDDIADDLPLEEDLPF